MKIKNLLSILIVIVLIQGVPKAHAAGHAWSGWYPVNSVYTYSNGTIFVSLKPGSAHPNPAGCKSASWLAAPVDAVNGDRLYQMALTAQAAGMKLNAYISGTECTGSYPRIYHMRTSS